MALLTGLMACANPWIPPPGDPESQTAVTRGNKPSRWVVGNYCGYGTRHGDLSARPVDRLDAACLEHDACFIEGRDRCDCNDQLTAAARAIIRDPASPPALRARARIIAGFFPAARPFCTMFPRGVMPPRRQDVLKTRYHEAGAHR